MVAPLWSPQDLVAATGGAWLRPPAGAFRPGGFCYAPALFRDGDMLLLRGDDAALGLAPFHARQLLPRAAGVICARPDLAPPDAACLLVPDNREALYALARYGRGRFRGRLFAVTGSAGKTSTCDMLAFALGRQGRVAATTHNTNLPAGVGRILAALPHDADHAVLELAIGRMARSARLARPHVALFTTIAPAHLEYHATLETVAERKSAIFTGLEPGGVAVINRDMPLFEMVAALAAPHAGRVLTYGEHSAAAARLLEHSPDNWVRARLDGADIDYRLGLTGRHMAVNSLGVLAALAAAGLDWRRAAADLAEARAVAGRGQPHRVRLDGRDVLLVDDAYNANPVSMRAAIALLGDLAPERGGRRVAVLGQMLELGPEAPRYHAELAEPLAAARADRVYVVGELMDHLWRRLPPALRGGQAGSIDALVALLRAELADGDVVVCKGSHGSKVHEAVEALLRLSGPAS